MRFFARLPDTLRILATHRQSGLFEPFWYLQENPDVRKENSRPFIHFAFRGVYEGRPPHPGFDVHKYVELHSDSAAASENPVLHYMLQGYRERKQLLGSFSDEALAIWSDSAPIPQEPPAPNSRLSTDVRAIAMYLPQFHRIPENDKWWGDGFTEWTNVRRALPFYEGHYQPHVPHQDIGYYDLDDPETMEKQASLARAAGIEGFCFYYYWFEGRRLLEMPVQRMLATGRPDFPFCFCWANEDWTRTWDGIGNEVLLEQKYSRASDEQFIRELLPAFRDSRYIRVEGKPLLVVYRPELLPNPLETSQRWRQVCRSQGIGEIMLAYLQSFEKPHPDLIGFDAAIQFPPLTAAAPVINESLNIHDSNKFQGSVRDYRALPGIFNTGQIGDKLWPGVCPSWDNTARRMERAHSWINATPENYFRWLSSVVAKMRACQPRGRRIVFINAWNEWAEGCHLEPDEKFGYGFLNATAKALESPSCKPVSQEPGNPVRLLVIGHDAARAGSQILLLSLLRGISHDPRFIVRLVLSRGGVLRRDFEELAPTLVLSDFDAAREPGQMLKECLKFKPSVVLSNTVANGGLLETIADSGVPVVTYVHELPKAIERWAPGSVMRSTVVNSEHFIAASKPVALNLTVNYGVPSARISCVNPHIATKHEVSDAELENLRDEIGIQPGESVVFGCGTMDWRKGPDIFASVALKVLKRIPAARFVWIGAPGGDSASKRVRNMAKHPRLQFIGERPNPRDYFSLGAVFFLSSREDPFPLVALEASDAGLPVVCFEEAGGIPEFVGVSRGVCVPPGDEAAAEDALVRLLTDSNCRTTLGAAAQRAVRENHDIAIGTGAVVEILTSLARLPQADRQTARVASESPLVSVIVPNYNHAAFLPERLESIASQTYPNVEFILLDDHSCDGSVEILREFVSREPRARLILNSENTGSPFLQWRKGLLSAAGKYIWIAESDDSASPQFLELLAARLEKNADAVLAACRPRMIGADGRNLGSPDQWFADIGGARWKKDFSAKGKDEIRQILSQKNSILNASGALFRNRADLADLVDVSMRLCADWLFWIRLMYAGDFEYVARPLNYWRLESSHARTSPPGETEWLEGKRVLAELSRLMGLSVADEGALLRVFEQRCKVWRKVTPVSPWQFESAA